MTSTRRRLYALCHIGLVTVPLFFLIAYQLDSCNSSSFDTTSLPDPIRTEQPTEQGQAPAVPSTSAPSTEISTLEDVPPDLTNPLPHDDNAIRPVNPALPDGGLPQDSSALQDSSTHQDNSINYPDASPLDGSSQPDAPLPVGSSNEGNANPNITALKLICPYQGPPLLYPDTFPPCKACNGAHCVPAPLIDKNLLGQVADCDSTNKCVPDEFIASAGLAIPSSCVSLYGSEGRCLSVCLPHVAAQKGILPRASCAPEHLCVPCYDPKTGARTSACTIACDQPKKRPTKAPDCCKHKGLCVPKSVIPTNYQSKFSQDVCPSAEGLLCVPNTFVQNPNYKGVDCQAGLFGHGRCLPECITGISGNPFFTSKGCPDGFKCIPCRTPLGATHACDPLKHIHFFIRLRRYQRAK